jgi:hypothetical protein
MAPFERDDAGMTTHPTGRRDRTWSSWVAGGLARRASRAAVAAPRSNVRTRPSWRSSSTLSSALQSSTIRPASMRLIVIPLISAGRPRWNPSSPNG